MSKRWEHEPKRKSRVDAEGKAFWREHEQRSAKRTKGIDRPRPNKGDGTSYGDLFTRECKSTVGESMAVKKDWFEKLDREALMARRHPLLVLGFEQMAPGVDKQWAVLPLSLFNEMVEAWGRS